MDSPKRKNDTPTTRKINSMKFQDWLTVWSVEEENMKTTITSPARWLRRALRTLTPARISEAIDHLRKAERAMMASATAGQVLADQAMIDVARVAARRR